MHRSLSTIALAAAVVACERPMDAPTSPESGLQSHGTSLHATSRSPKVERDLAALRAVTAPFHNFDKAVQAGWGARITPCFSDPELGGMGYHYGNPALIDGMVEALKPELLLYEPMQNGKLRLVAVEYVVPFTAWTAPAPPKLYGQSFHRNETFGLWVLHVWHFRHNPSGVFADWNPDVSCAFAAR